MKRTIFAALAVLFLFVSCDIREYIQQQKEELQKEDVQEQNRAVDPGDDGTIDPGEDEEY